MVLVAVVTTSAMPIKDIDQQILTEACRKHGLEVLRMLPDSPSTDSFRQLKLVPWDSLDEQGTLTISMECEKYSVAIVRSTWNYQDNELLFREWLNKVPCTMSSDSSYSTLIVILARCPPQAVNY
jgi:hypothetical protein